jgi:hypothetical protein
MFSSRECQPELGGRRKKMLNRKQISYDKTQSRAGLLRNRFVNCAGHC